MRREVPTFLVSRATEDARTTKQRSLRSVAHAKGRSFAFLPFEKLLHWAAKGSAEFVYCLQSGVVASS